MSPTSQLISDQVGAGAIRPGVFATLRALIVRDLIRFVRQPIRIAAAIGTPLLLFVFLAYGLGDSMILPAEEGGDGDGYTGFLLSGVITLIAVFASIFTSVQIIEDRNTGWLQAVLVSPAPRSSIAGGLIASGTLTASIQSLLLLGLIPLVGLSPGPVGMLIAAGGIITTSVAMTSLGVWFAWRCETVQGFHAVMNMVFMPMWLLSGAFFPVEGASPWLAWLMRINPLTWCTDFIREGLTGSVPGLAMLLSIAFAAAAIALTMMKIARETQR